MIYPASPSLSIDYWKEEVVCSLVLPLGRGGGESVGSSLLAFIGLVHLQVVLASPLLMERPFFFTCSSFCSQYYGVCGCSCSLAHPLLKWPQRESISQSINSEEKAGQGKVFPFTPLPSSFLTRANLSLLIWRSILHVFYSIIFVNEVNKESSRAGLSTFYALVKSNYMIASG